MHFAEFVGNIYFYCYYFTVPQLHSVPYMFGLTLNQTASEYPLDNENNSYVQKRHPKRAKYYI
jgi:hypothetical protein